MENVALVVHTANLKKALHALNQVEYIFLPMYTAILFKYLDIIVTTCDVMLS
jgi:hypothetical protein